MEQQTKEPDTSEKVIELKSPSTPPILSFPQMISTDGLLTYPEFVTLSTPALVKHDSYLYICFRERDDSLWISGSSDGEIYDLGSYKIQKALPSSGLLSYFSRAPDQANNIFTLYRPSMTVFDGYVFLSWTNKADNAIGMAKISDPSPPLKKSETSWTMLSNASIPTTAGSGPSIASFASRVFLAYRDTNSNIYVGSLGVSWNTFQQVTNSNNVPFKSSDGPTLLAVSGGALTTRLWICFRQINTVYFGYASFQSDGYTISGWTWTTISTPTNVVDTPIVSLLGTNLYCGYLGSDQKIYFGCSYNGGSSWTDWSLLSNSLAIGPPAIAALGWIFSTSFQTFSLDTNKRYVMTSYYDFTPVDSKKSKTPTQDTNKDDSQK